MLDSRIPLGFSLTLFLVHTSHTHNRGTLSGQDYPNVLFPDKWINETFPFDFLLRQRPSTEALLRKLAKSSFGLCHQEVQFQYGEGKRRNAALRRFTSITHG